MFLVIIRCAAIWPKATPLFPYRTPPAMSIRFAFNGSVAYFAAGVKVVRRGRWRLGYAGLNPNVRVNRILITAELGENVRIQPTRRASYTHDARTLHRHAFNSRKFEHV